jgi:hypothetical protein
MHDVTDGRDLDLPAAPPSTARAALVTFLAVDALAVGLLLWWGRQRWFLFDEWSFLAERDVSVDGLLRPHNGHWSTVPIAVYRAVWEVAGLRSYLAYQVPVVTAHAAVAALLRVVMRRAGVGPWVATCVAGAFALMGSVAPMWAFRITFLGTLVLGLTHLLLADHGGPIDRRDWLGLGVGLVSLSSSAVAIPLVLVVGLASVLRRCYGRAAFHVVPLAVVYLAWANAWGRPGDTDLGPGRVARFVGRGYAALLREVGQVPGVGVAIALLTVVGLAAALRGRTGPLAVPPRLAAPLALLAGSGAFLVAVATSRGTFGNEIAGSIRYVHVVAALTLPAVAVAADALVARWRPLGLLAVGLVLVGVPGNLLAGADDPSRNLALARALKASLLTIAEHPAAVDAPRDLRPEPGAARPVTVGWLLDAARDGRLPDAPDVSDTDRATAELKLLLMERVGETGRACAPLRGPVELSLARGEAFGVRGGIVSVAPVEWPEPVRPRPVRFGTTAFNRAPDHEVVAATRNLVVEVSPVGAVSLC